jgi:hypothetical protein
MAPSHSSFNTLCKRKKEKEKEDADADIKKA